MIAAHGLLGAAVADLGANTCTIDRRAPASPDFERYSRSVSQASQVRGQARSTLADYILSKAKLRKRGNPYQLSIQDSVASFYEGLLSPDGLDNRISGDLGAAVIETCEKIIAKAKLKGRVEQTRTQPAAGLEPTVLVLGGTGFIGRQLIKQLLDKGYAVRAAARGSSPALEELGSDRLQIARADMRSTADLERILDGIETVFHLATSDSKTWDEFVEREVDPARALARACLERGVKRLIYTGTINSFYAGGRAGTITEDTPLDRNIKRRNNYARAKAAAEDVLMEMHRKEGLPVVILRPGIVIGRGGNPFHWGVGKWSSEGVVETWGDGTNKLPLVLVDDVASGLVRAMETPGIEGRTYNLVDEPLLSARDYIAGLERLGGFKIEAHARPIWRFFLEDFAKWPIKVAVGHPDAQRVPSYSDWESRTQRAVFDSRRTREELGWTPISDPERMVSEGIGGSLRPGSRPGTERDKAVGGQRIHLFLRGRLRGCASAACRRRRADLRHARRMREAVQGPARCGRRAHDPQLRHSGSARGAATGRAPDRLARRRGYANSGLLHEAVAKDKSDAIVAHFPNMELLRAVMAGKNRAMAVLANSYNRKGPKAWLERRRVARLLNSPRLELVSNHCLPATNHLASFGVDRAKLIPWDVPHRFDPKDVAAEDARSRVKPSRLPLRVRYARTRALRTDPRGRATEGRRAGTQMFVRRVG